MPDFDEILKMAQNAQNELQKAQDNLDKVEVEGVSGGGMVTIRATAKGRILGVSIDDSLMQPSEKSMLEDLIAAAINDAPFVAAPARPAAMSPGRAAPALSTLRRKPTFVASTPTALAAS